MTTEDECEGCERPLSQCECEAICGSCNGSGEGRFDGTRCQSCGGSGVLLVREPEEPDPDYLRDRMIDDRLLFADERDIDDDR